MPLVGPVALSVCLLVHALGRLKEQNFLSFVKLRRSVAAVIAAGEALASFLVGAGAHFVPGSISYLLVCSNPSFVHRWGFPPFASAAAPLRQALAAVVMRASARVCAGRYAQVRGVDWCFLFGHRRVGATSSGDSNEPRACARAPPSYSGRCWHGQPTWHKISHVAPMWQESCQRGAELVG